MSFADDLAKDAESVGDEAPASLSQSLLADSHGLPESAGTSQPNAPQEDEAVPESVKKMNSGLPGTDYHSLSAAEKQEADAYFQRNQARGIAGFEHGVMKLPTLLAKGGARAADALGFGNKLTLGQGNLTPIVDKYADANDAAYQQQNGHTTSAKIGDFTGNFLAGLPAMGAVGKAGGMVADAAGTYLKGSNMLQIGASGVNNAIQGAAISGINPLNDEGNVADRMRQGAEWGGALGVAIPTAYLAGSKIADWMSKGINENVANLAQTAADKYGIKIPGGLLSENPIVKKSYSMLDRLGLTGTNDNMGRFVKAVGSTFGADTSTLDRSAMQKAGESIGDMFDNVAAKVPEVKVSNELLDNLARIESESSQVLPDESHRLIQKQIDSIQDLAAKNGGAIPTEQWQFLTGSKSPLSKLAARGNDPISGQAMELKDALQDAFVQSAPPEVQEQAQQAKTFYKNYKTVMMKGTDPVTGDFNPLVLANNVNRTASKYGTKGLETLQELGDIGQQFKLSQSSGTTENYLVAKMMGLLAEGGALAYDPILAAKTAGVAAAGVGAGRAAGAALSSDWYRNMLISHALGGGGGAFPPSSVSSAIPFAASGGNSLQKSFVDSQ
jgi:hypothetical protein